MICRLRLLSRTANGIQVASDQSLQMISGSYNNPTVICLLLSSMLQLSLARHRPLWVGTNTQSRLQEESIFVSALHNQAPAVGA